MFPLVAEYQCAVIAISNDETGISTDPKVRFEVARRIVQRAATYGIPPEDILIDPLVMPAGAVHGAGEAVIELVRRIGEELGCNTSAAPATSPSACPTARRSTPTSWRC